MKNKKTFILAESAVLLGLACALSLVQIFKMPMGGSVTLLSMLPIVLVSIKYGIRWGLCVAFLFAAFEFATGLGTVMTWGMSPQAVVGISALDYFVPYTLLGLAGVFRKTGFTGWCTGIAMVMFIRFASHFLSGVIIFGQWAPEGTTPIVHSIAYNSAYMMPELIFTMIGAVTLFKAPYVRKLFAPEQAA
ncbi:MAG: energy-coupled thiamine transporter ThiT [Oscillospiraceae bacterium]|nr:energy-coupled thiamine transporter ThiT [Oscillospiraceae bacterium]